MSSASRSSPDVQPHFETLEPRLLLDAIKEPYLQAVALDSIYVLVEADDQTAAVVDYGLDSSYGIQAFTESTESTAFGNYVHNVQLAGLLPNTEYHYSVTHGGTTSEDKTFWAAAEPGTDFRFGFMADSRSDSGTGLDQTVHAQIASLVDTFDPRMIVFGGDTNEYATWDSWDQEFFISQQQALNAEVPFANATGNHEGWNALTRAYTQGPDGDGGGYFSFDYGDTHFLILNNEISDGSGSDQWNFAAADLAATTQPWKIVAFHKPAYCVGGHSGDPDMQAMTTQIFEPNGVDMVLNGHSHYYQHNLVNDIHHMVIGSVNAPLRDPGTADYVVYTEKTYCFGIFDMTATTLDLTTYREDGSVIETINLLKDSTPPTAPTDLAATAASESQIDLTWTAATDDESGIDHYRIYRDTVLIDTTTGTTYSDTGLSEWTAYTYEVAAVNGDMMEGPMSNQADATTLADTTAPTLDSVAATSQTSLELVFGEPVEETSAENTDNYGIDQGVSILGAVLQPDTETVVLTTSPLTLNTTYMLTVNNVTDRASTPNPIAENTQQTFQYVVEETLTFQQGVNDYTAMVDTMIRGANPDDNFADSATQYDQPAYQYLINADTDSLGGPSHVLLRFDGIIGTDPGQIDPGSTVVSATLRLRSTDDGNGGDLHPVLLGWVDTDVTWNNSFGGDGVQADDVEAALLADDGITQNNPDTDVDFDVAATLQAWADGTANDGWAVLPGGTNGWHIATAEHPTLDWRPELIVTFLPLAPNDPPVAVDDSDTTNEDTAVTVAVLANDTDPDGDALSVESVTQGVNGSVVNNGSTVTYTPDADFNGADTFTYTVGDGQGGTDTATVSVTVTAVNDPPVANDQSAATDEDTPVAITLTGSDVDEDSLTYAVTTPVSGTLIGTAPNLTYTPDPNFNGDDSFTFTVDDGNGGTNTAIVSITVNPVNDAPVVASAIADVVVDEDAADTLLDLAGVFGDVDAGDSLTLSVTSNTNPALVTAAPSGTDLTLSYAADANGSSQVTVRATDLSGAWVEDTFTVTVNPVNDTPVAQDDSFDVNEDGSHSGALVATDVDAGDVLTYTLLSGPSHGSLTAFDAGTGAFTYEPESDFNGDDSFTFTVDDGNGGTDTAIVSIAVNPVNDAPVVASAIADVVVDEDAADTLLDLSAVFGDVDAGDSLTLSVTGNTNPGLVTADPSGTDLTLSYAADANGSSQVTVRATDLSGAWVEDAFTVTVNPVNDAPVAADDGYNVDEDSALIVAAPGLLSNDTDADGDPLSAVLVSDVSNGSLTLNANGSFDYTPNPDYVGSDSFTYKANDTHGDSNVATVTITVNAVNDLPVAADDAYTAEEDVLLSVPALVGVLANDSDPDGDALSPVLVGDVSNGTLTLNADGSFTYTPAPDYFGTDSFTYKANDTHGDSNVATVGITVNSINDAPLAADDAYQVDQDNTLTIDAATGVLANDTDVEDDPLSAILVSDASNGSLTLNPDGSFDYTPNAGYAGADSFTYTATDGLDDSNVATVSITVSAGEQIFYATDEFTASGTVIGDYEDTHASDDTSEALTEILVRQKSLLEHTWTFDLTGGDTLTFHVEAWHDGTEDHFKFQYSTDEAVWTDMLTVTKTGDDNVAQTYNLPAGLSGTLYVRVIDTVSRANERSLDTLFVDEMYITATSGGPQLPTVTVQATDAIAAEEALDTGTFTITRIGTSGNLTVYYAVSGTATGGDDYAALSGSVTILDGATSADVTITPIDDTDEEGTETVILTIIDDAAYRVGSPDGDTVSLLDNDLAAVDDYAQSESTTLGTETESDYTSTLESDNEYEVLTEILQRKKSVLDHTWTFDVTGGSTVTFNVEAYHDGTEDDFTFQYSTDGEIWTDMLTITKTSDDDALQTVALPDGLSGTLYVRVIDTNRVNKEITLSTLYVDQMFIHCE